MYRLDRMLCPSANHPHSPLKLTKISSKCVACYEDPLDNKQGYKCNICGLCLHEECINTIIPSRHTHPLKLNDLSLARSCSLCHNIPKLIIYKCLQCSFYICIPCARKPLIINQSKAHNHELLQLPVEVSFTCYACGLCIMEYPCFCLQCCFIIHRVCISLPRVICINRHDHRICHVSSLGPGEWICGVCYEHINGDYGAYSCLVCSYVAHSKCATSIHSWDGKELEGVPEENEEESKPFEVLDHNQIKHFSHEHNLKASLSSSRLEEPREHCYACTIPLYSELCYRCTQCEFILHDACANLPLKKRHETDSEKLVLHTKNMHNRSYFTCWACGRYCTGFSYYERISWIQIDVRCALISGAIKHESHPHLLVVIRAVNSSVRCDNCDLKTWFYLRCKNKDNCGGYNLCFGCATLPTLVRHKYDDHPLSLCFGEKIMNVPYCCGICEEEVYSKNWLYKCDECDSTFHTKCVFENLIHLRPGYSFQWEYSYTFDLLPNNHLSRPICDLCKIRCVGDFILNNQTYKNIFVCCSCWFYYRYRMMQV